MVGRIWTGMAGIVLAFSSASAAPAPLFGASDSLPGPVVHGIAAPQLDPDGNPVGAPPLGPYVPFKQGPDQIEDPFAPITAPNGEETAPAAGSDAVAGPEIHYGEADLPHAVARMRRVLMEAAKSGDVEELVGVFQQNEMPPSLGYERYDDPAAFLKDQSGDPEGREILALLLEILEAGWVHVDEGSAQEMYIWPYFDQWPLDGLSPSQEVELYRILTAGDVAEMRRYGEYIFYRVGIGPDGTLHYFMPSP